MKVYAAVLAGGKGLRMRSDIPKQFLPLNGKPVIQWSLETFASCPLVDHIILVGPKDYMDTMKNIAEEIQSSKILAVTEGGETRQGSSRNALLAADCSDDDIILFHDAARPFVTEKMISECIKKTKETGAAGIYIPASDTITEIHNSMVSAIPPRRNLYITQTPQGFTGRVIREGHRLAENDPSLSATDDVSLALAAGYKVAAAEGAPFNFKITTSFDLITAEAYARSIKKNPA